MVDQLIRNVDQLLRNDELVVSGPAPCPMRGPFHYTGGMDDGSDQFQRPGRLAILRCRECRRRFSPLDLFCPECGGWPRAWVALPVLVVLLSAWIVGRLTSRLRWPES